MSGSEIVELLAARRSRTEGRDPGFDRQRQARQSSSLRSIVVFVAASSPLLLKGVAFSSMINRSRC
jgi:hypothetical protein